jgi:hypothetical protein
MSPRRLALLLRGTTQQDRTVLEASLASPLDPDIQSTEAAEGTEPVVPEDLDEVDDDVSDDGLEEQMDTALLEKQVEATAQLMERFIPLLRTQKQYADQRFLAEQERQLSRAVGFMEDCLEVERLENSHTYEKPTTWGMKSTTMYLRPRPPNEIESSPRLAM